jgi:hypothetical protein
MSVVREQQNKGLMRRMPNNVGWMKQRKRVQQLGSNSLLFRRNELEWRICSEKGMRKETPK